MWKYATFLNSSGEHSRNMASSGAPEHIKPLSRVKTNMAQSSSRRHASTAVRKRKTLQKCFEEAQEMFNVRVATPLRQSKQVKGRVSAEEDDLQKFLKGKTLEDLTDELKRTSGDSGKQATEDEDIASNGRRKRVMERLAKIQEIGDSIFSVAPEMVSAVWFGISTLISVSVLNRVFRRFARRLLMLICTSFHPFCITPEKRFSRHVSPLRVSLRSALSGII